tara:strand:+ start:563 stop:1069 length:507 start_codon:yes stop_codon:yes gene_type:complete
MVKKILGYGLLVIIVFFVAIVTIPSTISPSVTKELKATPSQVHKALSNIQNFRFWDPKIISDSTVSYDFYSEDNIQCMQVTDSLSNIIATYKVVKSDLEEVQISVDIRDIDLVTYSFKLNKTNLGTEITWSMDFEINLMMYMLGAESKLEEMFSEGLNSFQETLMNNL